MEKVRDQCGRGKRTDRVDGGVAFELSVHESGYPYVLCAIHIQTSKQPVRLERAVPRYTSRHLISPSHDPAGKER